MVQYYINPVSGNDANTGIQDSAPFKTITHALRQVRTGDSIQLASGTYSAAGGEQFPLRIIDGVTVIGDEAQKGEGILIEGGGASYPSPLMEGHKPNVTIWLENNNIQLLGITAANHNPNGIGVWIESPNQIAPTVKNCTFTGCGKDESGKEGVGIAIIGGASPKISDNVIKLNKGCGLTVSPGSIIASEIASPVLLNNTIEQNFQDGLLVSDQCQPILGTSEKPGGNLLRGNCRYDIQNTGAETLVLVGNQLDPERVKGNVTIDGENNTVPPPLPCPRDPPTYTLSGRVIDRDTQQALAALRVEATFWDDTQTLLTGTSNTDDSGAFSLTFARSLFQGNPIRVSFQVYQSDQLLATEAAINNLQPANQQIIIDVFVEEDHMATITGKVTDANGNPVGGVTVEAKDAEGNKSSNDTDNEGLYTINDLPPGTYTVSVTAPPDIADKYHPANNVAVAAGRETTGIDFSLDIVKHFVGILDDDRFNIQTTISIEEANQAVALFSVVTLMLAGLSRRRVANTEKIDMLGVLNLYYGLQEDSLRDRLTFGNPTRLWQDLEKDLKDLAKDLDQLQSDLDFLNREAKRQFNLGLSNDVLGNVQFPVLFRRYVEIGSDPLLSFDIKEADKPGSFVDKTKIGQADDLLKELKSVILQVVRSLSKYGTAATKRVNEDWATFEARALEALQTVTQERVTPDQDLKNIWSVLADLIGKNRETEVVPYVVLARHGGKLLKYAMEIYELEKNQLDLFSRDHLRDLFQKDRDPQGFWTDRIRSEAAVIKRYPLPNWG